MTHSITSGQTPIGQKLAESNYIGNRTKAISSSTSRRLPVESTSLTVAIVTDHRRTAISEDLKAGDRRVLEASGATVVEYARARLIRTARGQKGRAGDGARAASHAADTARWRSEIAWNLRNPHREHSATRFHSAETVMKRRRFRVERPVHPVKFVEPVADSPLAG